MWLDAGVAHPEPELLDAGALAEAVCRGMQRQAAEQGLRLRFRCTGSALVITDGGMLGRIIRNLANNALRYTEHGGVLIAVRRRAGAIRIDVIDTGIGIPRDQHQEVFMEFRQLGNPQRDRRQGLGPGLAIVSRLVSLLGLRIEMRSELGRGTCFSLWLPSAPADAVSRPAITAMVPVTERLGAVRVLVLDDDADVLLAMRMVLGQCGCDTRTAASVAEAVGAVSGDWMPQLMLVDYRLPDVRDGIDAVARLRAIIGPVPAVIMTGDTGPEHLKRTEGSGLPVLHKPVRLDQLREVVSCTHAQDGTVSTRATQGSGRQGSDTCSTTPPTACT